MVKKEVKDIKEEDSVVINKVKYKVKKVEFSQIGKHGKSKARLELVDEQGKEIVLVKLTDDSVETY